MKARGRHYLFGIIFIGLAIYQAFTGDYVECALYALAGLAFMVNSLASEPRWSRFRKPLVVATWILIIVTGLLFLYLLQFHYA